MYKIFTNLLDLFINTCFGSSSKRYTRVKSSYLQVLQVIYDYHETTANERDILTTEPMILQNRNRAVY